jgi:hypothetical protein
VPGLDAGPELVATRQRAWDPLVAKVERLERAGLLAASRRAALQVQRADGGVANAELRGAVLRLLPEGSEEEAWRNALATLVRGFAA